MIELSLNRKTTAKIRPAFRDPTRSIDISLEAGIFEVGRIPWLVQMERVDTFVCDSLPLIV